MVAGPFANWMTPEGVALTRNIGSSGTLINDDAVNNVMAQTNHDAITEPNPMPANSWEVHHNGPHVWVDGQLAGLATAAQDTIFYMHHAFVDYIWKQFRTARPGSNTDYPVKGPLSHRPYVPMNPWRGILNIYGYHQYYDRYYDYESSPTTCPCGPSPYLECANGRCRSRVGVMPVAMAGPGMGGFGGMPMVAAFPSAGGPARSMASIARTGPIPTGRRFMTPFQDARTRSDPLPSSAARSRRSVDSSNATSPADVQIDGSAVNLEHGYTNSYVIDGTKDKEAWAYIPVSIIFEKRISRNDTRKPSATYAHCQESGSGADKIFVQTDGIDYSGRFKDYVIVDKRREIMSTIAYVGIKNPAESSSQFMVSAYDTCGRVCSPRCSTGDQFKPCSGTFYTDSQFPREYSPTVEDAITRVWKTDGRLLAQPLDGSIPVTFVCENGPSYPWYFQ